MIGRVSNRGSCLAHYRFRSRSRSRLGYGFRFRGGCHWLGLGRYLFLFRFASHFNRSFDFTDLFDAAGAGFDDHGLFELVLLHVIGLVVDKAKLMVAHGNHVAVLERVFLDELSIDIGAIGAVQVLQK